jgi:hypothetical protein
MLAKIIERAAAIKAGRAAEPTETKPRAKSTSRAKTIKKKTAAKRRTK